MRDCNFEDKCKSENWLEMWDKEAYPIIDLKIKEIYSKIDEIENGYKTIESKLKIICDFIKGKINV